MNEIETREALNSQHFWYVVFTIVFFGVLTLFVRSHGVVTVNVLLNISLFHFVILTLAAFRITRLFVSDKTTQWLRDLCLIVSFSTDASTGLPTIVRTKRVKGARRVFGEILECSWCTGMWVAFLVVVLYVMATAYLVIAAWIFLFIFALAGGAAAIQVVLSPSSIPQGANKAPELHSTPNVCTECGI